MEKSQPTGRECKIFENPVRRRVNPSGSSSSENDVAKQLEETAEHAETEHVYFHHEQHTTKLESFYDLFFVANLTVFTNVQEVSTTADLKRYVGYFTVLWFTWYQVSLYDVRFTSNSLFERLAKLLHLGVMISLAFAGGRYLVGEHETPETPFTYDILPTRLRDLTLALMAGRFMLSLQYLQILYFSWDYKPARIRLSIMASTYFVAAWIYCGLYFVPTPPPDQVYRIYIAWYIIGPVESLVATGLPALLPDKSVDFRGTHLTDRMALLTLIILGEGVIGLAESSQSFNQGVLSKLTSVTLGGVVSATVILFFLFNLYFDRLPEKSDGSAAQLFWSFAHFPFHVALVLAVEGIRRSVAWLAATSLAREIQGRVIDITSSLSANSSSETFHIAANSLVDNVIYPVGNQSLVAAETSEAVNQTVINQDKLFQVYQAIYDAPGIEKNRAAIDTFLYTTFSALYESAGFEPPEQEEHPEGSIYDQAYEAVGTFFETTQNYKITFIYFFVTIGAVVLLSAILHAVAGEPGSSMKQRLRLVATGLVGVALSLLALISLSEKEFYDFVASAWILPTVALALLLVFMINVSKFEGVGLGREPLVVEHHDCEN